MRKTVGYSFLVPCLTAALLSTGCPARKDAIAVSQPAYDFGLSRQPWNLEVWNSNSSLSRLDFSVSTPTPWITCSPTSGTSADAADRRVITVTVSRYGLAAGVHSGHIMITANGVKPRRVDVTLTSDGSEAQAGALRVEDVGYSYSSPYLMDFTFVIQDQHRAPVILEPAAIGVTCAEDNIPTSSVEAPAYLASASAKQGALYLVLDYTASMAATPGAINAMEAAVKDVLLPSLSADTLVGVYEFHRHDVAPARVCGFSADKDFVAAQIDTIRDLVGPFASATRCWDAVHAALGEFDTQNGRDETRNLVFISDGKDTSSARTPDEVRQRARARGVRVYGIGFGDELDMAALQAVTCSIPGRLYVALEASDIGAGFQHAADNLAAQYTLRWATLKRADIEFVPSFKLEIGDSRASYVSPVPFDVDDYKGNELEGVLRLAPSISGGRTTYFLRAAYVPRYMWDLHIYARSGSAFNVEKVAAADNGLCGDWEMTAEGGPIEGMRIRLSTPGPPSFETALPFASFGPILRFDFDGAAAPFTELYVDNSVYTAGQSFRIE